MRALFRCDATADIGFGHLSRCIALAEALRLKSVDTTFAGLFDPAAQDQIAASKFDAVRLTKAVNAQSDPRRVAAMIAENITFIVVDSYRADEKYLSHLGETGRPLVVFDDFCALESYPCDAILNFTWDAASFDYPEGPKLLLGPTFFPARRQLVEHRPESMGRNRIGPCRNLLIAIGGTDPKQIAARLIGILRDQHAGLCLHVVAANEEDFAQDLTGFAPGSAVLPRQPDLSKQFLWADACITGGGLIKYESAFMGVPAATVAQNAGQDGETQTLTKAGLVFDLGLADDRSDDQLASAMSKFLGDDELRSGVIDRVRASFPPDPSLRAARAILEAIRN